MKKNREERFIMTIVIIVVIFLSGFYLGIRQTKKYMQIVNVQDGKVVVFFESDDSYEEYLFDTID